MRLSKASIAAIGTLLASFLAPPSPAAPLRFHATGAAARAATGHQKDELGWGAAAPLAAELPLASQLGLQLSVGAMWMSSDQPPADPRFEPQGNATAYCAGLGLRARPFASDSRPATVSGHGVWLAGSGGVAMTNGLFRPMLDAHAGFDFMLSDGTVGMGPMAGLTHVFQPDTELRPADANIVLLGLHAEFGAPRGAGSSDRDGDGIVDADDRCPDDPEDKDGFEDHDGCPDLDNDRDGLQDSIDRCPNTPEDPDGFEDGDGCPELDNDQDRIPDKDDSCPNEPEDRDGFEDEDGCPDPDNDEDGILDKDDACPDEPETKNGYADEDGCPDDKDVRVVGDKIVLDDRVHFWTNSHIIRRDSFPLLRRVARIIKNNPSYVRIRVEGHADSRGPDSFNQPLSERRARSVAEFLEDEGIERSRLSFIGFGETQPLVEGTTDKALWLNRRVEFRITRKRHEDAETPSPEVPGARIVEEGIPLDEVTEEASP